MQISQITEDVKKKVIESAFDISYLLYTAKKRKDDEVLNYFLKGFKIVNTAKDFKDLESLIESIEIISDIEIFSSIQEALKQYNEKKLISLKEVRKELDL